MIRKIYHSIITWNYCHVLDIVLIAFITIDQCLFYWCHWIWFHDIKWNRLIGSYTSPYWRSGISSTSVRNSVFSREERSGTSGKTLNFSHEWKKSQIFNKDECKYLFLPFQLKNKACRFHSFIRMSMSCLLHKILQRHVQFSKYTLI